MSTNVLEKDITDLFGLEEMSKEDRDTFIQDVGELILESTVTRLMADMDESEQKTFETLVSEKSEQKDFLEVLEQEYPQITEVLREEIAAFKQEAISVLGVKTSE